MAAVAASHTLEPSDLFPFHHGSPGSHWANPIFRPINLELQIKRDHASPWWVFKAVTTVAEASFQSAISACRSVRAPFPSAPDPHMEGPLKERRKESGAEFTSELAIKINTIQLFNNVDRKMCVARIPRCSTELCWWCDESLSHTPLLASHSVRCLISKKAKTKCPLSCLRSRWTQDGVLCGLAMIEVYPPPNPSPRNLIPNSNAGKWWRL